MSAYRHLILLLSMFTAVGSSIVHMGVPFLIPSLQESGLSLSAAGLIAAMSAAGIVFMLIAWGWFVDRYGERATLFAGLTSTVLTTGFAALASSSSSALLGATLFLSGCAAASVNSVSGRMVSGWYPPYQCGTMMDIHQMTQPLGAALSAVTLYPLIQDYGIGIALAMPAILCVVLALLVLVGVKNPPRPDASSPTVTASPYRDDKYLVCIYIASALLSWSQSTMSAYILMWLLSVGYADSIAGTVVMVSQLLGTGSRALMDMVSDRVRSHIRPYRWVSGATSILAVAMMVASWADWRIFGTALICALAVAVVSPNGLVFTAVAEYAGPFWSGCAVGTQNTFQNTIYVVTPPVSGTIVAAAGFPALFAVTALFPAAALGIAPREDQNRHGRVELD